MPKFYFVFFLFPNVNTQYVGSGKYKFGLILLQAELEGLFKRNEVKKKKNFKKSLIWYDKIQKILIPCNLESPIILAKRPKKLNPRKFTNLAQYVVQTHQTVESYLPQPMTRLSESDPYIDWVRVNFLASQPNRVKCKLNPTRPDPWTTLGPSPRMLGSRRRSFSSSLGVGQGTLLR